MKLLLLEALLYWQAEFNLPPVRDPEVQLARLWPLVGFVGCLEVALALWIAGALRPLSPLS